MRPPSGCLLYPAALLVFVGGCVGGGIIGVRLTPGDRESAIYAPLPHHVAPSPDSASFRFAMVHDVIHERYAKHGPAFYEERERLAREKLAVLHPESEAAFALTDDIAVGLDRRGRTDEAIVLMRDKLKRQQAIGMTGKELYSSYANLGEFLVRGNLWGMMAGVQGPRERLNEGRDLMRKSVAVNSDAHNGLEAWQLVATSFLIDASYRPKLISNCDLIGNRLDRDVEFMTRQRAELYDRDRQTDLGRPYAPFWVGAVDMKGWDRSSLPNDPEPAIRKYVRDYMPKIGGEKAPDGASDGTHGKRAPFDEPALWLIGEWRQGSGPSPHYALCLGEIMLRVGQRYIGWDCYERASRMAEQFWPTPELQQFLRDHCRARQKAIEDSLSPDEVAKLRPKFESELAFGEQYQRDYQEYEEQTIKAGANLNDEHFYDDFHTPHGLIASKVGPEEWYAGSTDHGRMTAKYEAFVEWGLFTGGAAVLVGSLFLLWLTRPKPPRLQLREISLPNNHQIP
jgi:hypothetical protein